MPIPVGTTVAPAPDPEPVPTPEPTPTPPTPPATTAPTAPRPPRLTGFGVEFHRAGHETIVFATKGSGDGWKALTGAQGLDLPPVQMTTVPIPDGYGDVHLGSRYGPREPFLRLGVSDATYEANRDRVRALWAMVGDLQPFDVVIRQPEGQRRRVTARYVTGLEGSYTDADWWVNRRHIGLTVLALDPLAYGDQVTATWSMTEGAARPFLSDTSDVFPIILGDSLVGGERVLHNAGDVEAFTVATLTGPSDSSVVLENLTTGRRITVEGGLVVGESVTIDGRRGVSEVFDSAGADAWNRVPIGEFPWPLARGENRVKVTMTGALVGSRVSMSWAPPFRSLH